MIAHSLGNPIILSDKSIWLSDDDISDWFFIHRKKNICGFRLVPSVVLSQIAEFLQQMSVCSEIACIGLVDCDDVFSSKQIEFLNDLGVTFYQSKLGQSQILSQLKIIFLQESNFSPEDFYSNNTIRIGLSHGIDIPLKKTLLQYGGLLEFDYVLCAKPYSSLADDAFINLTVPELRTHQKPFCCAVPFGVPKFDRFLRLCQRNIKPKALVYHLSNLKIEHPDVPFIIEDTLRFLLENYPERTVYFRPFPDDLLENSIKNIHENCKGYPNYRLSNDACYIEDYSNAKVMICHRDYSEHLFSQASGRPIVVLHPSRLKVQNQNNKIDFSDFRTELDQFINRDSDSIYKSHVFNQGNSVSYLLDNLEYILGDKKHPDWQYFQLSRPQAVNRTQLIAYYLAGSLPFHKVSLRNLDLFPQEPTSWMAALISLGRAAVYTNVQLSQMYWMEIVFILQRIVQTNIPTECHDRLKIWFRLLPLICRTFVLEQMEISFPKSSTLELLDSLRPIDEQAEVNTPDLPLFIQNRDLNHQLPAGEIQLYGAGELTRQLLADPRFISRFVIVRLVDSNPGIQGAVVAGLVVESPDLLHQSVAPVLVCSRAFSEEIEYVLRYQLALNRELYVIH
jgi:hypothetical protein